MNQIKNVSTLTGGGGSNLAGFTMAEILLSLTIIGVVAAITLPSLTGNINERTWNTQRKALYARFSQAIALMPALNGYGILTAATSTTSAEDTAAETFVTSGLAKVLKINNICDSEHLEDCGIPQKIVALDGNIAFSAFPKTLADYNNMFSGTFSTSSLTYTYNQINTKAAAFETANGESIVVYYNPYCQADNNETGYYYTQPKMCANFIYDLNGSKGPNTVGKDIGVITALYSSDSSVVAPMPIIQGRRDGVTHVQATALCKTLDDESRLPTKDEASSIFYNRLLFGVQDVRLSFWTSSRVSSAANSAWLMEFYAGHMWTQPLDYTPSAMCVKR